MEEPARRTTTTPGVAGTMQDDNAAFLRGQELTAMTNKQLRQLILQTTSNSDRTLAVSEPSELRRRTRP